MIMRIRHAIPAAMALMLFLPGSAAMDKLYDFKEAASKDGCEAIPYQSERVTCKDRQADKNRVCLAYSCNRSAVMEDLDTYKDTLRKLQDAKDRKDGQSVNSHEKTVKTLEAKLNEHRALAKQSIQNGYDCLETRERVQRSFSDARQMVQNERDAELQSYVQPLVDKYQRGRVEHDSPIQEAIRAIDNCKWVSGISW